MNSLDTVPFKEIWCVDFEFGASAGERPEVRCMVAREIRSGKCWRLWANELTNLKAPPFGIGPEQLFVAFYSSAEFGCFLKLGWELPKNVLDLFVEYRNFTNGLHKDVSNSLIGAMAYFNLDAISVAEKQEMRELALRGGEYTPAEKTSLLEYCETDVVALTKLLPKMATNIDWPRALLRGRYMKAVAHMEYNGVPIDTETLRDLRTHWEGMQKFLVREVDSHFGVYEGTTFKLDKFEALLQQNGVIWPRLDTGHLKLDDEIFKEMALCFPFLEPLRQLRSTLSGLRLNDLAVGKDGRNRCLLSPFQARTGRNQPSNSKFIFGPASWFRSLIKPSEGMAIAYIDWSQQEFGIAAALSGDEKMREAYESGDPYLEFAKQAGAVPSEATKKSHKAERDQFKACVLAVQYGMGKDSLAKRIGQPVPMANRLLELHQQTYKKFWMWSDETVDHAMLLGFLHTTFGWEIHIEKDPNTRMLRNFPMQANGAEMMRLAACLITEAGIRLCAPVHDALMVEAPIGKIDEVIRQTQELMEIASKIILGDMTLKSDADIIKYPDRYVSEKGQEMWSKVSSLLEKLKATSGSQA